MVDYGLVVLILLNIGSVTVESARSVSGDFQAYFDAFEVFSVAVFSIECLGRVWSIVDSEDPRFRHPVRGRLFYIISPLALVDRWRCCRSS